jgi:hypothetical protein
MLSRFKAQLSPALVISMIALFVSLGGAGYAAVSVTGKDVKNSSLTGKDVKNSSLTGSDVKNSSLTTSDVKNKSLLANDFKSGQLPQGPQGPQGAKGDTGAPGPFPDPLQSGKTLRGTYAIDYVAAAGGAAQRASIPFIFTLASAPTTNLLAPAAASTAACPGSAANPEAAPGNLCVYQALRSNVSSDCIAELTSAPSNCNLSDKFGTGVFTTAAAAGRVENRGSWAVTAP